jgi:regulation of enolase protein 1 (concanavalin A-like superfamily)
VVDASSDGLRWEQVRMAHLHDEREDTTVACGLYSCSPRGVGFVAKFAFLTIDKGRLS